MSDRTDKIEAYLAGSMGKDARSAFESEIESDHTLRDDIAKMRVIYAALELSVEEDLRAKLNTLAQGHNTPVRVRKLFPRWAAAASILLILGFGLWYVFGIERTSVDQFAEAHYLTYDNSHVRGEHNEKNGFPDLTHGDSQVILAALKNWLESHPEDSEARFVYADLLKKEGETRASKEAYAVVAEQQSVLWSEKAAWNYVLLSAQVDWDTRAQALLEGMLKNPAHSYHSQAKELERILH